MKVLLKQDVPNVGRTGEVKTVADGYARNFLIPRGLVTPATGGAVKRAEQVKAAARGKQVRAQNELKDLAVVLEHTELVFKAKVGEQHRLFGSITAGDIAEELSQKVSRSVDKRDVELEEPIRHLGSYKVPVRVAPRLVPSVTVVVEAEAV
ncbi:MAG TPA: 50S ribosomal protein L9 [Chloroflexota bacterium]|nr:50S ribosomal protein L9 [Chloroflexota bacterium]